MRKIIPLRIFQILIIIFVSSGLGYLLGVSRVAVLWKGYEPIVKIESAAPPPSQTLDMSLFYEILDKVNQEYYDKSKLNSLKFLYGAINGALQSLGDPYTSFFPPRENQEFKTQLSGQFEGIGAELSLTSDNRIGVVAPLDGSPAQKSGIKAGDTILKVNGEDTANWTVPQAVEKIRGPKGTKVTLTILHEKDKNPKEIKITRDVILVKSVTTWVKKINCTRDKCSEEANGKPIAYIRLSQFGDKTNDEWINVINALNKKILQEEDFRGIVLDLRNNPGGYLNDAVFIASEFLSDGIVVIQEDSSRVQSEMRVSRRGIFLSEPLIVLINKGSASASEIVAGALSNHKRAKLVGTKTFGKGTIQQALEVDRGASLHLSIAKWLTPSGAWVDKKGIEPDIEAELDASGSAEVKDGGFDNQLAAAIRELL